MAEPSGPTEPPDGPDPFGTRLYAIGEGVLGGLLLALLALALWYLAPVAPPTAAERWLVVTASVTVSGAVTGALRPRREPGDETGTSGTPPD
ncbi:hypothetical protein [Actinomadura gamaensis]|uniref:Uncharacterized protein n=1 Tax=Actinomadura gamaensis TaxID=1763541 RepID=A0ABV9U487_9ACTN